MDSHVDHVDHVRFVSHDHVDHVHNVAILKLGIHLTNEQRTRMFVVIIQ